MPSRHEGSDGSRTINRRNVLTTIGAAGAAGLAGCGDQEGDPGEDDDSDDGEGLFPLEVQLEVNADNDDRVQMVGLIAESMEQSGYFDTEIETYEWNTYTGRVLDPEYQNNGYIPCIGLSGTFNPHSFCDALHNSANIGACCNLNGINDPELDELLDTARFGVDVAEDPQLRAERYDEIWRLLAEEAYSSITHFDLATAVTNTDVHGFNMWPFNEGIFSYNMYAPQDEQVMWLDSDSEAGDSDLSDLVEGGTMRGGLGANVDSFDPPNSSDTTSTMAQGFLFEGLTASDAEGNIYPWLAEDFEQLDVQDTDRSDYEEYMRTVEVDDEGVPQTDEYAIVQSDPEDGEIGILTHEDAREAAADGVYGMHFRYHLHEGVEFHNGDELTAEDVVATYEYAEDTVIAPQTYDSVLAVVEVDEYTVDMYAQVADAEGERELPGLLILNSTQIDEVGDDETIDPREGHTPIGTGPYEFDEFEDEQFYEVEAFDDYWVEQKGVEEAFSWFDGPSDFPDGPVIDAFELEIVPDDATRSGALQNDEIDITYGLATGTLDDFDADDGYIVHGVETGGYEYIQYPVNIEPWDDRRLRQAVNHLVPRQAIVDNVLNGWGRPAWTDLPELAHGSGTVDHDALEEEIRPLNEFDPERAEELLEQVAADHGG